MAIIKKRWTEPQLLVSSSAGIYSMKECWNSLSKRYKRQALKRIGAENVKSLEEGPDNEFHWDAAMALEGVVFETPTGQRFSIVRNEDTWAVPFCFMRKMIYESWFI
jgi:hypothetical protein